MALLDIRPIEPWIADVRSWCALAQLVDDLRQQRVVPLLGAGASQAIGFPGWSEAVLRLGRRRDPQLGKLPGDPLFLADKFRQALKSPGDYLAFFDQEFACGDGMRAKIRASKLWQALARLPCQLWMTLNYDSALEFALADIGGRNPLPVDWAERGQVNRLLLGNVPETDVACVHLHGLVPLERARDGSARGDAAQRRFVLTEQEYQQRYLRSDEDRSKLFVLFTAKVVLFVGCSMTDLDLMGILREVKAKLGFAGHRHYALLAEPANDAEAEARSRDRLRLKYGVEPIFFRNPEGDFAGAPAVLQFLTAASPHADGVLHLPQTLAEAIDDDPHKGRFGLTATRGPFRVGTALVGAADAHHQLVDIVVQGPGARARFHLHPTFPEQVVECPFQGGRAILSIQAWGAFTVGVEVDDASGRRHVLELDLAEDETLPWDFRQL